MYEPKRVRFNKILNSALKDCNYKCKITFYNKFLQEL